MKNVLKQLGKGICYIILFLGIQFLINVIFQFVYGFQLGMELAATGTMLDEQATTNQIMEFIVNNTNWITLISGVLTLLILWLFFKVRKKKLHHEAQIFKCDKKMILPLILSGIALSFLISSVLSLLPIPESILESYMEQSSGVTSGGFLLRLLAVVIVVPLVEEIIFRGLIISRLKRAMRPWAAILISSFVFGLMHGQVLWIAYAFVLGVLLALIAERTKSVGASILVHMSFNAVSLFGEYINFSNVQLLFVGVISLVVTIGLGYYVSVIGQSKEAISG